MNNLRSRCMFLIGIVLLLGLTPGVLAAAPVASLDARALQADDTARVLVLHSYHPEYLWDQELNTGILDGLAAGGYSEANGNLEIEHFWMDTKQLDRSEWGLQATDARQAIRDFQPDVVIISDNNAISFIAASWDMRNPVPFVFAGLNSDPEDIPGLVERRSFITGVLERVHVDQTLNWIQLVIPDASRVLVLADNSETTLAYIDEVEAALQAAPRFADGYEIETSNNLSRWEDLAAQASNNGVDVIIIGTYSTVRDADNQFVSSQDLMTRLVALSEVPIVPLWEFGVQDGALGGTVISGVTQGYEAAQQAVRIIDGEEPGDIEIIAPERGRLVVNTAAVARWDVAIPLDLLELSVIYGPGGSLVNR
ncbi:MAG: hypothetical protein GYB65_16080 [Chloroflexi bacterium]|nr:hypothetical protein [Chloroflexota bacterium]